jgi:hypothetical protein
MVQFMVSTDAQLPAAASIRRVGPRSRLTRTLVELSMPRKLGLEPKILALACYFFNPTLPRRRRRPSRDIPDTRAWFSAGLPGTLVACPPPNEDFDITQ